MQRTDLASFNLPDCPGVYLFTKGKGRNKKVLYVGKATSLRDRVRSYFDDDLIATRGSRVVDMVTLADSISHETTPTVLEALVREAALIREYLPKANVEGKDDKSFLYTIFTKEPIPRVLMVRGKDIDFKKKTTLLGDAFTHIYGPFTSGIQLRVALRLIRRIFPFYDTERRVGDGNKHVRAKIEFNRQIGQYPRNMDAKAYARSIRHVRLFLSGKVQALRTTLEKEMKQAAKEERFEDAALFRKQLFAIDHVQDVSLIREERERTNDGIRIEAYDVAHLSGTNAIGVMVVVENGVPIKKEYRTFKIKGVMRTNTPSSRQNNDIASLKEILERRLTHTEWQYPKVIVVDGGKTHKKAAEETLTRLGIGIPVTAVVKNEKHQPREVIGSIRAHITDADAVLANAEAHRFSLARHRDARSRGVKKI